MTGSELDAALTAIGWTRQTLAERTGRSWNNIDQMVRGEVAVPDEIADWLREMIAYQQRNPTPRPPRKRPGPGKRKETDGT